MEAIKIVLDYIERDTNINSHCAIDIVKFILDNPSYNLAIVRNKRNTRDIIHDIIGLMREYEYFVPRVLFKTNEFKFKII